MIRDVRVETTLTFAQNSSGVPIRGCQDNLTNDLLHGMGSKGARPHRVRMYAHAAHKALCLQIHFFSLFGKV